MKQWVLTDLISGILKVEKPEVQGSSKEQGFLYANLT